jgi:predicted ATPase
MSALTRVHIEELRLVGYRAFENARLRLDDLTVLVGRNGAGKSTLIDALELVRDALSDSLEIALDRRGGLPALLHRGSRTARELAVAVKLRLPARSLHEAVRSMDLPMAVHDEERLGDATALYGFRLGPSRGQGGFRIKQEFAQVGAHRQVRVEARGRVKAGQIGLRLAPSPVMPSQNSLALPFLSGGNPLMRALMDALKVSVRAYRLSPEAIRAEPPIGRASILSSNGNNVGDVLHRIEWNKPARTWIIKHLAAIAPGIVDIKSGAAAGRRLVQFFQRGKDSTRIRFDIGNMSDGTLRCLAMLLALRQEPMPTLVCIEEIEDSVHPAALGVLLDAIAASADRCQILLTSHSPEALSHSAVTPERVRVVEWRAGRSQLFRLSPGAEEKSRPPHSVGKLLRANALFTADTSEQVEEQLFAEP